MLRCWFLDSRTARWNRIGRCAPSLYSVTLEMFLAATSAMLYAARCADDCAAALYDKCVPLTMSGTCVTLTPCDTPGGWQSSVAQQLPWNSKVASARTRGCWGREITSVFFCCSVLVSFSRRLARRVIAHPSASMGQSPPKSHAVSRFLIALLTSCVVCVFFTRCAGV